MKKSKQGKKFLVEKTVNYYYVVEADSIFAAKEKAMGMNIAQCHDQEIVDYVTIPYEYSTYHKV